MLTAARRSSPGAGASGWTMWVGFVGAQLYVLGRLIVKLQFLASQTALFQASLAHAAYTAAPVPVWPAGWSGGWRCCRPTANGGEVPRLSAENRRPTSPGPFPREGPLQTNVAAGHLPHRLRPGYGGQA